MSPKHCPRFHLLDEALMPKNPEHISYKDHEAFLAHFDFTRRIKLHGETPAFGHYVEKDFNKLSGNYKERDVYPPNDAMRAINEALLKKLERLRIPMPHATGGIKKGSPLKNIEPHATSRFFCLMDLKGAYEQVDMFSLAHTLVGCGLDADVVMLEEFLVRYCRRPEGLGLATGAPSCPMLFNIACQNLDHSLGTVSEEYGWMYTRYLDDLTFSTPAQSTHDEGRIGRTKRQVIGSVIEENGFAVNTKKTKSLDLEKGPIIVTGLQLNRSGHWQLPTHIVAEIGEMFRGFRGGDWLSDSEWDEAAGYFGLVVSSLDKTRGFRTPAEFDAIEAFRRIRRLHRGQIRANNGKIRRERFGH